MSSSINPHYTMNYSQPEDYHFSHDSIFLGRRVFDLLKQQDLSNWAVLDLCAGCGIVGMEFLFHRRHEGLSTPQTMDFLEVQPVYAPHFEENKHRFGPVPTNLKFLLGNYADLAATSEDGECEDGGRYDMILCNPPYFFPDKGMMSPSEFKNRCRFFIDSDFPTLLTAIARALKPKASAYVLLRDLPQHGFDVLKAAREVSADRLAIQCLGDIRGTNFVKMTCLDQGFGGQ